MKLDSRILKGEKYLDCFDVDIAEQFIGKKGYFSHYVDNFADLKSTVFGTLGSIEEASRESFVCTEEPFDNYYYEFFLPAEWVKEPEKKYRAFTNEEFIKLFDSGKLHSIRLKDNSTKRLERLIITDIYVQGDYLYAKLNSSDTGYGPAYFFSKCEYFDGKEWQPFGIEVEE